MRIYDQEKDSTLNSITLCLSKTEAIELKDSLQLLLKDRKKIRHEHINDSNFSHEITVVLYDEKSVDFLNDRIKKVIENDI